MQKLFISRGSWVCSFLLAAGMGTTAHAQEHGGEGAPHAPSEHAPSEHAAPEHAPPEHAPPHAEPHPGPQGYQRPAEPQGWNKRPPQVDRAAYQHNYSAARSYHIGPYRRPPGWTAHRWGYGEILPRAYWGPQYLIGDYWLFGLEVPPVNYEWVRDGNDALLIDTNSGEILQVEYGVFS
jgi:Ni/Co efflux regulator RcnB